MSDKQQVLSRRSQDIVTRKYPLFRFDFEKNRYARDSWSKSFQVLNDSIAWQSSTIMTNEHGIESISEGLTKIYPHLRFYVLLGTAGADVKCWVVRNGRSGEGFSRDLPPLHDPELHIALTLCEQEAVKALQDGWFLCTGHNRAEQKQPGWYFHFAGEYCKEYGDANPKHRETAARETYA